jgi:hypothetical protein
MSPPISDDEDDMPMVSDDDQKAIKVVYKSRGRGEETIDVPLFPSDPYALYNKSAIFYGGSGSGKTTLIRHFMYNMKGLFPYVVAFAPTNFEKHDYDRHIPRQLIYEEFGMDDIKQIYLRQRAASSIVAQTKNKEIIRLLFLRCRDLSAIAKERDFYAKRHSAIEKTKLKYADAPNTMKKLIDQINDCVDKECMQLHRMTIHRNAESLLATELSDEESTIVRFVRFNANALVFFDDATQELEELIKTSKKGGKGKDKATKAGEDAVIHNFFFKGRWANITHWYAAHDDTSIATGLRRNAMINFFTDQPAAISWVSKENNGISRQERPKVEAIIDKVLGEAGPKNAKLVFVKDERKFYYIVAELHEEFDMCSNIAREFCNRIDGINDMNDDNEYIGRFKDVAMA